MKTKVLLTALALALSACAGVAQNRAAERGNATATINGKQVSVNYGRPSLGGRDMLAQAKTGTVWRVGMNQATEITSAGQLVVGDKTLDAGKYSLWVRKTGDDTWTLAFHPKTGIWGKPEMTEGYVAEMPLKLEKAADSADLLDIGLADKGNGNAQITIHWGTAVLTGTFGVK
ncbi:MAG: DUF2911 domain-containing protein [Acidobacteriota bacterium]|nr:DUF2911 domain-containing protein [Acidobacteriota bacterium]